MPNDTTAVAAAPAIKLTPVSDNSEFAELLDSDRFAQIQRVAKLFSQSDLVPEVFRGKEANCAIALQMAFRMRIDPMMLMQSMYVVHGRPGIEAKLAIALMNQRGPFTGPLQWKNSGEGADREWTCYATHRVTGEVCSMTVTWAMVMAEGWADKAGSKWKTIPDLMGRYRSAAWLGRVYCPEVLLGLPFDDELRDSDRERAVAGERVDEPAIPLPQPKAGNVAPAVPAEAQATSAPAEAVPGPSGPGLEAGGSSGGAGGSIDPQTGEVIQARKPEGADQLDKAIEGDPMAAKRLASPAQREAIEAVAKKRGLSAAQLNDALVEKFSEPLSKLPAIAFNTAIVYVSNLKP